MSKVVFLKGLLDVIEFCINCILGSQAITVATITDDATQKLFDAAVELGVLVAPADPTAVEATYTLADKYDELDGSNVSVTPLSGEIVLAVIAKAATEGEG